MQAQARPSFDEMLAADGSVRPAYAGYREWYDEQDLGWLRRQTIQSQDTESGQAGAGAFAASIIVAGQIAGMEPRMFLVYPEGNFIEASEDTPFFQIGETKYGRPILLRGYDRDMAFADAVKLMMVSFDSTLRANLSVGMPLDLLVIERDSFAALHERRIKADDPYFKTISNGWGEALKNAFHALPDYPFACQSG